MSTQRTRRDWIVYLGVAVAEAAYVILMLLAPKAPQSSDSPIHLTPLQTVLLQLSIVVPYLVAWLAGARGALGFKQCGETVPDEEGGAGFRAFGVGVAVLVGGGLLSSLVGTFAPYFRPNTSGAIALVIANNYLYVLTNLLSTLFLFRGATHLVKRADDRAHERDDLIMAGILGVIIAALYLPLVFSNPARQASSLPSTAATYYLPDALILLTLAVPYLVAWTLGFLTALRISRYAPPERDSNQKKAVRKFVNGLWMMIFSSILLQLLVSIGTARLLSLGIGAILGLVYVFLMLQIVGYAMISIGSKRLCRPTQPRRALEVKAVTPL